ncbi:hypothetical protein AB4Z01_05490 [Inquilinus sp. YAF38]|jgi:hypothetical protein|uniref:hypothetical protein n=1 Tax=Inquilinus sp. YAF38 TaxID=3233084 RepID=UPI003F93DBF6
MFDRLIGKLFQRAERRAAEDFQANARAINEKVRLLAKLGGAGSVSPAACRKYSASGA